MILYNEILRKGGKIGVLAMIMSIPDPAGRENVERIYEINRQIMWKIANYILDDSAQSQDVVLEVMEKFINNFQNLDLSDSGSVRMLLIQMSRNAAIDRLRKNERETKVLKKKLAENSAVETGADSSLEELILSRESLMAAKEAILALPQELRADFMLHYFHNISVGKIAQISGVSEAAIYKRLKKAKRLIRLRLKEAGYYDGKIE